MVESTLETDYVRCKKLTVSEGITGTGFVLEELLTGISFSGDTTTAIDFTSGCTPTDHIKVSGASTNAININTVGTTSMIALHFIDAYTGMFCETGTYQSAASGGITLTATNARPVSFLFDDAGTTIAGSANCRAVLSRVYLAETPTAGCTVVPIQGQLKIADAKNYPAGRFCAVDGYIELAGDTTVASGGYLAGMNARIDIPSAKTLTVASGGYLIGLHVQTTGTGTLTSTGNSIGILINDQGTIDDWKVGIDINNATTGISIGNCTTGIDFAGAATNDIIATTVGTGTDGWLLRAGEAGSHLTSATAGGAIVIYNDVSAGSGTTRTIWAETALTLTGGSLSTNLYTIRGHAKLGASVEVDGAAYIAGVQGKFTLNGGTINHADSRYAAVFAQLDLSSGTYTTAQVSGLWVDATLGGTMNGAQLNLLRLTCSTPAVTTINSILYAYSEGDFFMDIGAPEGNADWFGATAGAAVGNTTHKIKIQIGEATGYLVVYDDVAS